MKEASGREGARGDAGQVGVIGDFTSREYYVSNSTTTNIRISCRSFWLASYSAKRSLDLYLIMDNCDICVQLATVPRRVLEVEIHYLAIVIIIISLGSVLMYINAYQHIYPSFWGWELRHGVFPLGYTDIDAYKYIGGDAANWLGCGER